MGELYWWLVAAELALAVVTFVALCFVVAPYGGRHGRPGWGPTVPSRVGWVVMEAPASLAFVAFYLLGAHRFETVPLLFLLLWQAHYVQRAFVYPFLMRSGSRMPVLLMLLAIVFNLLNASVSDIDYYYTSRLPGEPADGVNDIHTHPAEPREVRFSLTAKL